MDLKLIKQIKCHHFCSENVSGLEEEHKNEISV